MLETVRSNTFASRPLCFLISSERNSPPRPRSCLHALNWSLPRQLVTLPHHFKLQPQRRRKSNRVQPLHPLLLLHQPNLPTALVRLLRPRRHPTHLRPPPSRLALRRRRLRLGQQRTIHRSLALALLPTHRPRGRIQDRRSHDTAYIRSRHLPLRPLQRVRDTAWCSALERFE